MGDVKWESCNRSWPDLPFNVTNNHQRLSVPFRDLTEDAEIHCRRGRVNADFRRYTVGINERDEKIDFTALIPGSFFTMLHRICVGAQCFPMLRFPDSYVYLPILPFLHWLAFHRAMTFLTKAQIEQLVAGIQAHDAEMAAQRSNLQVVNTDEDASVVVEEVTDCPGVNKDASLRLVRQIPVSLSWAKPHCSQGVLDSPDSNTSFEYKPSAIGDVPCDTSYPHCCLRYLSASAGELAFLKHHFQKQRKARKDTRNVKDFRAMAKWHPWGMGNGNSPLRQELKLEDVVKNIPRAVPLQQRKSSFLSSSSDESK